MRDERAVTSERERLDTRLPADRLEALFAPLSDADGIVAAVSGGADSVALMHLLADWRSHDPRPAVTVATVDHGLRKEARDEAALVARQAERLGLPHRTLVRRGSGPMRRSQAAARDLRYRLLTDFAVGLGASHLVTAHTMDDQAETVLMRLARGSGPAGLAAMRAYVRRDGLVHARPLLGWRKAELAALCLARQAPFVDDPSNADERYARARIRRLMPVLAAEGLSAERLARFAERLLHLEEALDAKAKDALVRARRGSGEPLELSAAALVEEPYQIAVRVLSLAVGEVEGAEPARLERLERCTLELIAAARAGRGLRRSLGGAVIALAHEHVSVTRATARRRGAGMRGAR